MAILKINAEILIPFAHAKYHSHDVYATWRAEPIKLTDLVPLARPHRSDTPDWIYFPCTQTAIHKFDTYLDTLYTSQS